MKLGTLSAQGALDATWIWRDLPALSSGRVGCGGYVFNNGRFAVLSGSNRYAGIGDMSPCEALTLSNEEHCETFPLMRDSWALFARAVLLDANDVDRRSDSMGASSRGAWSVAAVDRERKLYYKNFCRYVFYTAFENGW
jgi:hypothetical protein